ncbi:2-oxo-4-hydroxy-4-carboxy-5-ureidoimidazoline decarboxylase [Leifsonia sp. AG29]|uniref:2-oxo-4-hydroxy-4-carboxy-5-ureidoimidazoline decarboxylase n=1 Tax=Leifsonia sp. AG29 TaxID=2598860 RepID=UPI00131DF4EA
MTPTFDADALRPLLPTALAVPRWVEDVIARAPYDTLDALVGAAVAAATPLSEAEIDQALAHHPRIGERPTGEGASQQLSRKEQQATDADDAELAAAIAAGNRAYEERFGRVFLIRAAGRSRREVLAELERRLGNPAEVELAEVAEQLRQIAALRLRTLLATPRSRVTTHVLDIAAGRPVPGVPVHLDSWTSAGWQRIASGATDADGRVAHLGPAELAVGRYRLTFATAAYLGPEAFLPEVLVVFVLGDAEAHYHVPLLLSPFGYSTYRGS